MLINAAIYLRASVAIFMRFARKSFIPALDFLLFAAGIYFSQLFWQDYKSVDFLEGLVQLAIPLYALVWVLSILVSGGYDKPFRFTRIIVGTLLGSAAILIVYALLPETYRFSRAVILLGTIWSLFSFLLSRPLLHLLGLGDFTLQPKTRKKFAIVGSAGEVQRVEGLLKNSAIKPETVVHVYPGKETSPTEKEQGFVAGINQLQQVVEIFGVEEIVFCSKDIELGDIITNMAVVQARDVEYKIAPPESVFIIGSSSIDTQGDLYYVVEINAISKPFAQRNKRMFDVFFSLSFLLISPVLLVMVKRKSGFIANIFNVLFSQKSWVGYASSNELPLLPKIKKGVLSPIDLLEEKNIAKTTVNKLNLIYARDYSLMKDFDIIWKGIRKLGNS